MKDLLPNVGTDDGLYSNGNPATGVPGTRVTAEALNGFQGHIQTLETEVLNVIKAAGIEPSNSDKAQLLAAINKFIPILSSSVTSDSTTDAANSLAVKTAYDAAEKARLKADNAIKKTGDTATGKITFNAGINTSLIEKTSSGSLDLRSGGVIRFFAYDNVSPLFEFYKNLFLCRKDITVRGMITTGIDGLTPGIDPLQKTDIDGIWHDESTNKWYFQSDAPYKSKTNLNSTVIARDFETDSGIKLSEMGRFTQNFAENGWCKLPNGLILQWGFVSARAFVQSYATVAFPISFNQSFNVSITPALRDSDYDHWVDSGVHDVTNSRFKIFSWINGDNFIGFYWTAIGK
ncbi:hypothetical protein CEP49_06820 [Mergibacter septicus]|uniref:gp53-like domain-containing protein n=1 Tax=Mergibacter septicus TaxID=221402 RepID=UPI0011797A1F|nr:tail fiber protein [Mergibacter septicus]AWX14281.1 hypothetical protein CEP49_06820 [Mergibacter septicus]